MCSYATIRILERKSLISLRKVHVRKKRYTDRNSLRDNRGMQTYTLAPRKRRPCISAMCGGEVDGEAIGFNGRPRHARRISISRVCCEQSDWLRPLGLSDYFYFFFRFVLPWRPERYIYICMYSPSTAVSMCSCLRCCCYYYYCLWYNTFRSFRPNPDHQRVIITMIMYG